LGKELVERGGKLDSELRRVERVAIDQVDSYPVAELALQPVLARREIAGRKTDALNATRGQVIGEFLRLEPRRARDLEVRVRAATHAHVGAFDHADAGIKRS